MESVKRIVHVDDNNLFRDALLEAFAANPLLSNTNKLEIVHSFSNGFDAVKACAHETFDLVILDINMPELNGFTTAQEILTNNIAQKILILSKHASAKDLERSINIGAKGHLSKDCDMEELRFAIHKILGGNTYFNSNNLVHLLNDSASGVNLTPDELTLLRLFCEEKTTSQAGTIMRRSERAINYLKRQLQTKVGVRSKAGLAIYAVRNNLI